MTSTYVLYQYILHLVHCCLYDYKNFIALIFAVLAFFCISFLRERLMLPLNLFIDNYSSYASDVNYFRTNEKKSNVSIVSHIREENHCEISKIGEINRKKNTKSMSRKILINDDSRIQSSHDDL